MRCVCLMDIILHLYLSKFTPGHFMPFCTGSYSHHPNLFHAENRKLWTTNQRWTTARQSGQKPKYTHTLTWVCRWMWFYHSQSLSVSFSLFLILAMTRKNLTAVNGKEEVKIITQLISLGKCKWCKTVFKRWSQYTSEKNSQNQ